MAFQYVPAYPQQATQYAQPQQQQQGQQQQLNPQSIMKMIEKFKSGGTASPTGTSGNMGMGSDAASLANAESLSGLSGTMGTSGSMGMGSDAASLAAAEAGMGGGSSGGAAGAGGMGAAGILGVIAAAIALQHGLSTDTDTEVEGVKTKDAFKGHFATEPWLAWAHDKLGLEPTAGEKFDAAVENEDWGAAFGRGGEALNYWLDPGATWAASGAEALGMSEEASKLVFNPIGALQGWLGERIS